MKADVKVRTNFLGPVLLLIGALASLAGYYSIGLSVPLLLLGVYCLATREREFIGLISVSQYRIVYLSLLLIGAIVWCFLDFMYAVSFFLGAILFSLSEPIVQKVFSILSLLGLVQ